MHAVGARQSANAVWSGSDIRKSTGTRLQSSALTKLFLLIVMTPKVKCDANLPAGVAGEQRGGAGLEFHFENAPMLVYDRGNPQRQYV